MPSCDFVFLVVSVGINTLVILWIIPGNLPLTSVLYHGSTGLSFTRGDVGTVDSETRRKKQKALMRQMLERKVRSRAQQLYESRGQAEGQDLQDWFQAESELIENSTIASLYLRSATEKHEGRQDAAGLEIPAEEYEEAV